MTLPDIDSQKFYSPVEVGNLLGKDRKTIFRWIQKGYLPHQKVSRFYMIKGEDVVRYLNRKKTVNLIIEKADTDRIIDLLKQHAPELKKKGITITFGEVTDASPEVIEAVEKHIGNTK